MLRQIFMLVCLVCFTFIHVNAQFKLKNLKDYKEGIHLGYRADFWGYKEYKHVKEFYNDKRPWLEKSLGENVWMNGFEFGLGTQSNFGGATLFNIAYSTRKDKTKGILPNGVEFKRSIRIRQFTIDAIDAWWTPFHINGFDFGFGTMPLGVMWCSFQTKYDGEKPANGPFSKGSFNYSDILNNMDLYSTLHIDIIRRSIDKNTGLRFQFFFYKGWESTTNDLILLSQELNPNTYSEHRKRTLLQNTHFGIKTLLFI